MLKLVSRAEYDAFVAELVRVESIDAVTEADGTAVMMTVGQGEPGITYAIHYQRGGEADTLDVDAVERDRLLQAGKQEFGHEFGAWRDWQRVERCLWVGLRRWFDAGFLMLFAFQGPHWGKCLARGGGVRPHHVGARLVLASAG
jgi:hypothetical protein